MAYHDRRTTALIPALFHEMFGDPMDNQRGWSICPVSSFVTELYSTTSRSPSSLTPVAVALITFLRIRLVALYAYWKLTTS